MDLSNSVLNTLPRKWEEVVAYRFSFVFIVRRELYTTQSL